jgi:hypothetical protein
MCKSGFNIHFWRKGYGLTFHYSIATTCWQLARCQPPSLIVIWSVVVMAQNSVVLVVVSTYTGRPLPRPLALGRQPVPHRLLPGRQLDRALATLPTNGAQLKSLVGP